MRNSNIDFCRGIAILIMVLANSAPYILINVNPPFFLRFLFSIAAPVFVFLSGYSLMMSIQKGKSNKKVDTTDVKKVTVETKEEETKIDVVSDTDVVVDLTDEMKEENYILEDTEFDVEDFTYKGKVYLKCTTTHNIYDIKTEDEIGKWDEKTNTIHFKPM